jgi:hypothetical protein
MHRNFLLAAAAAICFSVLSGPAAARAAKNLKSKPTEAPK